MGHADLMDCSEVLLDLVCYEIQSGRLSPEMAGIFDEHLLECENCRTKVLRFRRVLGECRVACQEFG